MDSPNIPAWASSSVWYQIYPLGFFDCSPQNDHTEPQEDKLSALAAWYDYLEELGVGVILFNPLFESDSHGYDTTDYFDVDRRLGTVAAFRKMIFDVAHFWLADVGVDGWRLDVAHEIEPAFWREFAATCTAARPDVFLVGELIHGDYRRWVAKGVLHSATNYQLSHALWHSVVDRNYFELVHSMQRCQ
eukprot:gene1300-1887_t